MASEWERLYGQFSLQRLGLEPKNKQDLSWPALLTSSYSHNNYRIIELNSQQELENEGRRLEHCVASYAYECLMSGSYIYSVRDRLGNSLSTFEVKVIDGMPEITQHLAYENGEPSDKEIQIGQLFLKNVLFNVSREQIIKNVELRYEIGNQVRGKLLKVDTLEAPLDSDELMRLYEMVEFTHPSQAKKKGILKYFEKNCRHVSMQI